MCQKITISCRVPIDILVWVASEVSSLKVMIVGNLEQKVCFYSRCSHPFQQNTWQVIQAQNFCYYHRVSTTRTEVEAHHCKGYTFFYNGLLFNKILFITYSTIYGLYRLPRPLLQPEGAGMDARSTTLIP